MSWSGGQWGTSGLELLEPGGCCQQASTAGGRNQRCLEELPFQEEGDSICKGPEAVRWGLSESK